MKSKLKKKKDKEKKEKEKKEKEEKAAKEKEKKDETPNPYRARLLEFYTTYAPEKVSGVDSTLEKFKGREEDIFKALETKYAAQIKAKKEKDSTNDQEKKQLQLKQKAVRVAVIIEVV